MAAARFCSITAHQGRIIQSRSQRFDHRARFDSMADDPKFKGVISDIGGPTANMYEMKCTRPEVEAVCRRQSCVHPTICKLLGTDHGPLIDLMREARETPGIKKVLVASGIRMDLGATFRRIHARPRPAPRGWTPESRPGTHRSACPGQDAQAEQRRFREVLGGLPARVRSGPARSSMSSRISSPAIPAATWTR